MPREAFGVIRVAASVESVFDADQAFERGYLPALLVGKFDGPNTYSLPQSMHGLKLIPCRFETRGKTCVECRLCLDQTPKRAAIGFEPHGRDKTKVEQRLLPLSALLNTSDRSEVDR